MARQSHPPPDLPTILLTRPLAQSLRFAEQLGNSVAGLKVVICPLMAVEYLMPTLSGRIFSAVILTSETGVEAARRISAAGTPLPKRAFCVGDQTAAAALLCGFDAVSAKGNADDLFRLITATRPIESLLFLHGENVVGNLEERLNFAKIETVSRVVYRQNPQSLSPLARQVLAANTPVILPVFSTRSATIFGADVRQSPVAAPLWVVAISEAVAKASTLFNPEKMEIAQHPDAIAMLAAVKMLVGTYLGS